MERLTKRDSQGNAIPVKTSTATFVGTIYEEEKELERERLDRLAEFEDMLESGRLVDITPYIIEIKNEIPFKYKVIKPTIHRRNVEMCSSRESAERCIAKLTKAKEDTR